MLGLFSKRFFAHGHAAPKMGTQVFMDISVAGDTYSTNICPKLARTLSLYAPESMGSAIRTALSTELSLDISFREEI